ncbi:hypothetical protein ACFL96_04220 [Thermoproteota archaeon]
MKPRNIILISIGVVVLIILAYLGLYMYSLSQVELRNLVLDEIEMQETGFSLSGEIEMYNGGLVTIGINWLNYTVHLESTGDLLGKGHLTGTDIKPKQGKNYPFSTDIEWVPSADLAKQLIEPGQANIIVKGNVSVSLLDKRIPFEKKVDIKPFLMKFAVEQAADLIGKAIGALSDILTG